MLSALRVFRNLVVQCAYFGGAYPLLHDRGLGTPALHKHILEAPPVGVIHSIRDVPSLVSDQDMCSLQVGGGLARGLCTVCCTSGARLIALPALF